MAVFRIPLVAAPQRFTITLGGVEYNLRFQYRDAPNAGWIMDVYTINGDPIICGQPLITGADLLGQFKYLGIAGGMLVLSDANPSLVPTFESLGVTSHLYYFSETDTP